MTGEALSAFHFERPAWLLLVLPALALWWLRRHGADEEARWRQVIDPALLRYLLVGRQQAPRLTPETLLLAAWLLGTVAAAGPAWQREPAPFADAKPPVVIVLKVTPSMATADLAPTRLDRARQKLADLLALREGAATGLVAYAGSSHLVLPPTPDTGVVVGLAQALAPEIMPSEGDDLASAVALADRVLSGDERGGSILVLADEAPASGSQAMATRPVHPLTLLAMLPPEQGQEAVAPAAAALGATIVAATVDQSDITAVARRLDRAGAVGDAAAEQEHWQEAGYWLTPLLAFLALFWFRRGWVLT